MIVISSALVLVAAVLLVFGIVWSIPLVYAAIVLSIVSAIFLLFSVFQRPPQDSPLRSSSAGGLQVDTSAGGLEDGLKTSAEVLVISGRPLYHVKGCSFVEYPADAEPLGISEARELGFTPCDECRPDEAPAKG